MPQELGNNTLNILRNKLERLTQLLLLEQQARQKETQMELGFLIANNTHQLCSYSRCIYWSKRGRQITPHHASGISKLERNTPFYKNYVFLIKKMTKKKTKRINKDQPHWARLTSVNIDELSVQDKKKVSPHLKNNVLLIEFLSPNQTCFAGITLEGDTPFSSADKALFEHVCESYAHALYSVYIRRNKGYGGLIRSFLRHKKTVLASILVIGAMFIPVRASVTVPAEIIAASPYIISSPIEGVIKDVLVSPNQQITIQDELILFDDTLLRNKLEIAQKELLVLDAELDQSLREAFSDQKSKTQIALLKGEIEKKLSETNYYEEDLKKTKIIAPQSSIAVFSDPNELRGKHFRIGQKIMTLADPENVRLLIRIPSEAMIKIDTKAEVELYLNESPLLPDKADLNYIEYQATQGPDGLLSYKAYANFQLKDKRLKLGARGTAKMYGDSTILADQIFRRPLVSIRRYLML